MQLRPQARLKQDLQQKSDPGKKIMSFKMFQQLDIFARLKLFSFKCLKGRIKNTNLK